MRFSLARIFAILAVTFKLAVSLAVWIAPSRVAISVVLFGEFAPLWIPALLAGIVTLVQRSRQAPAGEAEEQGHIRRFMWQSFLSSVVGALVLNVEVIAASHVLPASGVVTLAAALRFVQGYRQILGWAVQPALSSAMRLFCGAGAEGLRRVWHRVHPVTVEASIATCCLTLVIGIFALPRLLGVNAGLEDVRAAVLTLGFLLAGVAVASAHLVGLTLATALGVPATFVPLQLVWTLGKVALIAVVGPKYGVVACAVAVAFVTLFVEPFYMQRLSTTLDVAYGDLLRGALFPAVGGFVGLCGLTVLAFYSPEIAAALLAGLAALALRRVGALWQVVRHG